MLKGRLGLEGAHVPQSDRHGLLWLHRGNLYVADGCLHFTAAGFADMPPGDYAIPFQMLSCLLMGPGTTVSHDALRLLARHGTGLVMVGEEGVRMYASMPFGPDESSRARHQIEAWSDPARRSHIVRRMYGWRLGEVLPNAEISVLRGIEGARAKQSYRLLAEQYGLSWSGRHYDRADPEAADLQNQAINHASTAVQAIAMVAVAVTGTLPQIGFIHEHSGVAFPLDIADLFRDSLTLPIAFAAVRDHQKQPNQTIERVTRKLAGKTFRREKLVAKMIDRIKELFDADDRHRDE